VADEQEIEEKTRPNGSIDVGADQVVPSNVTAWPEKSTATQDELVAQESEPRRPEESTSAGADQVVPLNVTSCPE